VYGRWGNGYVFNNNYINKDQAKREVEKKLGYEIEIARNIQFDPGKLDKSWIGNCCAIGLSSNFVEPLEATSIGTAIAQAFLLKDYIFNYKQEDVNDYNHKLNLIMENVRDFIALHYMIDKEDTPFWKDNKNNPMPDTLIYNLKKWKDKLPKTEDFKSTEYLLFKEQNFTSVLHGLGFYKGNENIDKEFDSFPKDLRDRIKEILNQYDIGFDATPKVPHKKFLKSLYENK
jgi:tryptophan halogenase